MDSFEYGKNKSHSIYEEVCVTYVYAATMRTIRSAAGMKRYAGAGRNIVISLGKYRIPRTDGRVLLGLTSFACEV